jgi:hypothetical protein
LAASVGTIGGNKLGRRAMDVGIQMIFASYGYENIEGPPGLGPKSSAGADRR